MSNAFVSVLIPIYGVEKYIQRCAESLFAQTYRNIEFIFVNDCTKDRSVDILKTVVDVFPNRNGQVKIIEHDQNRGLAAARNTAVAAAHGEFVIHVDSDDYIATDIVEKLVKKQSETNADIVCTDVYLCVDQNKEVIKYPYDENNISFIRNVFYGKQESWVWGKLIRKKLYVDNYIKVEEGCNMAEDFQVLPRLAYFSNRIAYVKEPLYFYECSNAYSYCKKVSENQKMQQWRSFEINYEFFKNSDLKKDLDYCCAEMIYSHMKQFVRYDSLRNNYYFFLKEKWKKILPKTKRNLQCKKKVFISFCCCCNPSVLKIFGRIIWRR